MSNKIRPEKTESENGELQGGFIEGNTVERAIKAEIDTGTEEDGVGKLGWVMSDITSPRREGEPAGTHDTKVRSRS